MLWRHYGGHAEPTETPHDRPVVTNCLVVLDEILCESGGIVVNQQIAHYLLNRLRNFNEWSQATVLTLLKRYRPASADEVLDILNILEVRCTSARMPARAVVADTQTRPDAGMRQERLRHANSAVVFAAAKIFLQYTESTGEIENDVFVRLKTVLLTFVASPDQELVYIALCHIQLMLARRPRLVENEIKQFFCRYNDSGYVKKLKLEILTASCAEQHVKMVVDELVEYVTDVDVDMARSSIRSIGTIAIRLEGDAVAYCIGVLLDLLNLDTDYVCGEALVVMQDLLRKYPAHQSRVLAVLRRCVGRARWPRARYSWRVCLCVWLWLCQHHAAHRRAQRSRRDCMDAGRVRRATAGGAVSA